MPRKIDWADRIRKMKEFWSLYDGDIEAVAAAMNSTPATIRVWASAARKGGWKIPPGKGGGLVVPGPEVGDEP